MTPKNKSVIRMIEVEEEAIFLNTLNTPALTRSSGDYYFQRTGSQKTSYHVKLTYVGVSDLLLGYQKTKKKKKKRRNEKKGKQAKQTIESFSLSQ